MTRNFRRSSSATAREIAEIGQLLRQLEGRLGHLGASATAQAREAGSAIPAMISDALSDLTERFRDSDLAERFRDTVRDRARNVGDQAARAGSSAWHKIEDEIGHRPLATLALAAGIGFLVGVLGRRS